LTLNIMSALTRVSRMRVASLQRLTGTRKQNTKLSVGSKRSRPFFSAHLERASFSTQPAGSILFSSLDDPDLFQQVPFDEVQSLASKPVQPMKLSHLYRFGGSSDPSQRLRNAQFLHEELPIRIAQRILELRSICVAGTFSASIRSVTTSYLRYLAKLLEVPPIRTADDEDDFTDLLQSMMQDHATIAANIAAGVQEIHAQEEFRDISHLEDALVRFFTARVGLRLLSEHHVASSARSNRRLPSDVVSWDGEQPQNCDGVRGCIDSNCAVVPLVHQVADAIREQTVAYMGTCPPISIVDCTTQQHHKFTYVPHHLQHVVAELLKNAVRAVIRKHRTALPAVQVIVAQGCEDVTIKIADRGGGISRSALPNLWQFSHSTAPATELEAEFGKVLGGARVRGFGLPLARIYARYFGGDLTLKSTEGYGLDAYLYLPRLGDAGENLPTRVQLSPGGRDSTPNLFQ